MEHSYATNSAVPVERSKGQIRGYLAQAGADGFGDVEQGRRVALAFVIEGHQYRISFELPDINAPKFSKTPTGRMRSTRDSIRLHDQAIRSYWRTILMAIKGQCEMIAIGE